MGLNTHTRASGSWALVPIKARAQCKTRLTALPPDARQRLVALLLERVMGALRSAYTIERIAIVTPEPDDLPDDALGLFEEAPGLNAALSVAREQLRCRGARDVVILPADLPFVSGRDIDAFVEHGRRRGFALASDTAGVGTNALYLPPSVPFEFQFGPRSRTLHLAQAMRLGLAPAVVHNEGLEFDLDQNGDLARLSAHADERFRTFSIPMEQPCPVMT